MPEQDRIDQELARPMNGELAKRVIEKLLELGVTQVSLCAGARNSPLLIALQDCPQIRVWHFFEERSAAFFALGRSWARNREPVAIITTSGTAAGELLPAMMEAYYAGIPLIAVTADRPRSFRGTGAPQSAEQVGLYSYYVSHSYDIASSIEVEAVEPIGDAPCHLNVCFSEPLLDQPVAVEPRTPGLRKLTSHPEQVSQLLAALNRMTHPLLILSQLGPNPLLAKLVANAECLIYAEAPSQYRRFHPRVLRAGADRVPALAARGEIDGVIRVGGVPTLRFWRDLEDRFANLPVVSLCSPLFSGLSRSSDVFSLSESHLEALLAYLKGCDRRALGKALEDDAHAFAKLEHLLATYPRSEPGWLRWLDENIGGDTRVFLGNSLPVREWDLAARYDHTPSAVHASRGLNGIDGQVSTFLGWAEPDVPNVGIFGDLTSLYDLSAPWILQQVPELEVKIVVLNNRGGQIFERMFGNPWFINAHDLNFESWAGLWKMEYARDEAILTATSRQVICEINPDPAETRAFWQAYMK